MKSISADIANSVNITLRRNDSFYLKVDLSNDDGTNYNLLDSSGDSFTSNLSIYNSNDEIVLGFSSTTATSPTISNTITVSESSIVIDSIASSMSLYTGTYKYKLVVSGDDQVHTIMVGKIKVIDI